VVTQGDQRARAAPSPFFFIALVFFITGVILSGPGLSDNFSLQPAYGQERQERQSLKVMREGKEYDVQYNSTAKVQSIELRGSDMNINLFNITQDGRIELRIPMDLAKSLFFPGNSPASIESFAIFVDGREPTESGVLVPSCESLVITTDFIKGSEQIIIAISSMSGNDGGSTSAQQSGIPVTQTLQLPEGEFEIDLVTNALRCDLTLIKEEKKLHIDIAGRAWEVGYLQITIPHKVLGGNYSLVIDNKTVSNFNTTSLEDSTIVSTTYDGGAKAIDIIGTTVIPEFPFPLLVAIAGITGVISIIRGKISK
jgi:hypothetical protein